MECLIDDYAPESDPIPDLVSLPSRYKTHGGSIIAREAFNSITKIEITPQTTHE